MQPKEVVDLAQFVSEWSRCLTAKYQADHLWRFGKFDDCEHPWRDLKTAFVAKLSNDEAEARKLLAATKYHEQFGTSSTIGIIWEAKEKPGWN